MTDENKPGFDTELEDELPGDEELDEELDQDLEAQDEIDESEAESGADAVAPRASRLGRGKERAAAAHEHLGSVREGHERVHVDDRASAIFAIICAGALLLLLAGAWAGQFIPKGAVPTLTPLVVPTSNATAAPSASASASIAP
jgi:hypothetical protein